MEIDAALEWNRERGLLQNSSAQNNPQMRGAIGQCAMRNHAIQIADPEDLESVLVAKFVQGEALAGEGPGQQLHAFLSRDADYVFNKDVRDGSQRGEKPVGKVAPALPGDVPSKILEALTERGPAGVDKDRHGSHTGKLTHRLDTRSSRRVVFPDKKDDPERPRLGLALGHRQGFWTPFIL